ncbi:MAG: exosortase system-associated protein, TIGR04073 family [Verrucomicrobia bacterium]|nr:exosortase system-associated protein, TIGR04073 family [Verrucomicrobiota bacterium]
MRILTVLFVVLFVSTGSLRAENAPSYAEDVVQDMSSKLNRGVWNVLTGWGEIPRQMIKSGHDKGWWAVIPVGIPAGVIMGVGRTGVGVFEAVTFFIPIHESYDPVLEPAFVWQ